MKNFPLSKYLYIMKDNEITASTTYAGKPVTGKATCASFDDYDEEDGKKLAAYRCAVKVAMLRFKRARNKKNEMRKQLESTQQQYEDSMNYFGDSLKQLIEADRQLKDFEDYMKA